MRFRGVAGFLAAVALLAGCAPSAPDHLLPTRSAEGFQARQYIPPVDILELDFYQDDAGVHAFVLLTSDDEYATAAPLYVGVEYVNPKGRIIGSSTRIAEFQWVGQEVAVTMMATQDTLTTKDVAGILPTIAFSRTGRADPSAPAEDLPPLPVIAVDTIEQATPDLYSPQFTFRNTTGTSVADFRATIPCKDAAGDLIAVTWAYGEPVLPGGSLTFSPYVPSPVRPDSCTAYLAHTL